MTGSGGDWAPSITPSGVIKTDDDEIPSSPDWIFSHRLFIRVQLPALV